MSGQSKSNQVTDQSSTQNPWAPAQPLLTGIANQATSLLPGAGTLNGQQQGAIDQLSQNASAGNPYAGQIGNFATDLLNGGGANAQAPQVQGAYDQYKSQVMPWANGSMGDPNQNPALRGMLDVIQNDVGNSVNGQFAAAGRDLSGANQQAYGRGIAQGYAPVLMQAQQQGLQTAGDLYNAGNTTSGLLSGLNQTALGNKGVGVEAAGSALDAQNYGANAQLAAQAQKLGIPTQQLGLLASLGISLGQVGGTTTGHSQTQGTMMMSPWQQATSGIGAIGSLFPKGK